MWGALDSLATILGVIGPVAALTVFLGEGGLFGSSFYFETSFEMIVVFVGFLFGVYAQGKGLRGWWLSGRKRDSTSIILAAGALVLVVGTAIQAYELSGVESASASVALIPAFVTGVGSVATIILNASARERRLSNHQDSAAPEVLVRKMTAAQRGVVLEDRRKALEILEERGMLNGEDLTELNARALGELAPTTSEGGKSEG